MALTDWQTAAATLRVGAQLVDGIQKGLAARGFDDVRPVHGFAFAVLAGNPTTTTALAAALDITKQAAAQLVAHLVDHGYLVREQDPDDARAQLLILTDRGHACTAAAEAAAADVVAGWRERVPTPAFTAFNQTLEAIVVPGRLRPAW